MPNATGDATIVIRMLPYMGVPMLSPSEGRTLERSTCGQ